MSYNDRVCKLDTDLYTAVFEIIDYTAAFAAYGMDGQKFAEIEKIHMVAVESQPFRAQLIGDTACPQRVAEEPARPAETAHHPGVALDGRVHRLVPVEYIVPAVSGEKISSGVAVGQIKAAGGALAPRRKAGQAGGAVGKFLPEAVEFGEQSKVGGAFLEDFSASHRL